MSESFVDLSYRGLGLGKRIKLTQVRPSTGFLELPTPMPVGTAIGIATDEGVLLEAQVAEIQEQVGGSERVAGMLVKPKLDTDAARSWWSSRVALPTEKPAREAPPPDADGKVTVMSPRMTGHAAIPELVDDGRNTAVMDAIADGEPHVAAAALDGDTDRRPRVTDRTMAAVSAPRDTQPIVDDGKRTMMMDAVDLEALGLDPAASSGSMPAMAATSDDEAGTGSDKPDASGGKKKKKKRR